MRLRAPATDDLEAKRFGVSLDNLTGADVAGAGTKAVNLGLMRRAGLPVPPGFCVTAGAYRLWTAGRPEVESLLAALADSGAAGGPEICRRAAALRQGLATAPMPAAVAGAIREAAQRHPANVAWAVRSSATMEDLPGASCAGQHDSFLQVSGTSALLEAVRQCWVSLFTDRAVCYRFERRLPQRTAAMAVVVQEMVPAEVAGVLFTADPLTGNAQQMVIESVPGLGETLVSGQVSPARLVLARDPFRVLESKPGGPPPATAPADALSPRQAEPAAPAPPARCLDETIARTLARLGCDAERLLTGPQDIEWAACQGRVFLLQARPITALPPPAADQPPDVWTNANAVEALPDVVTPMSWSVMDCLLKEFLNPLMRWLGVDTAHRPLVGLIAGRAYLNIRAILDLVRTVAGPLPVDFAETFGGDRAALEPFMQAHAAGRRRALNFQNLRTLLKLSGWLLPALPRQQRLIDRWREVSFGDLSRASPAGLSDEQLGNHPRALLVPACAGEGMSTWAAATWMCVAAVGATTAVARLTRRWLDDADRTIANRLIAGAGGMNSAENGLELLRLAAWTRPRPALRRALRETASFEAVARRLAEVPDGRAFLERWQTFMDRHGHQARGGMDVAQPRWAEQPDFALGLLQTYLQFSDAEDPLARQAGRAGEREALLAECRRRLRNPIKSRLLEFLVRTGQRGLVQRENVKNEGVRMIALMRRAMLEAGRRLVERGALRAVDDVFFLRLEELTPALLGRLPFDLPATIAERQLQHAANQALTPPTVVVGRYDPHATAPVPVAGTEDDGLRAARSASGPCHRDPFTEEPLTLQGLAVSPGIATGKARVIRQADVGERVLPGEILVAPYTDPGWTPYFLAAAGIVVDVGGLLSHGSVVAREYGLPAVVNVGTATRQIRTGQTIRVDGYRGLVTVLE